MAIKNIFGKGKAVYGKGSSKLNLPSQSIDRRKKQHSDYRSSNPRSGELKKIDEVFYVVFDDGSKEKLESQASLE